MGFKLRREVRDLLPPGLLTARERCLVLEIADSCDDEKRVGYPGVEWLAEKADLPESKVGEMVAKVGKKWLELRVPLGVGKDNRPYYSRPKRRTTYRFPPKPELEAIFTQKAPESGAPCEGVPQNGVPKAPESGVPKAPQNGGGRSPETGGPSPYRSPHGSPQSNTSTAREIRDVPSRPDWWTFAHDVLAEAGGGWSEGDIRILVREAEAMYPIDGPGWWVKVQQTGTAGDLIEKLVAHNRQRRREQEDGQQAQAMLADDPWASWRPEASV